MTAVEGRTDVPRAGIRAKRGLIAQGIERADIFHRAAACVDRILSGEKPSNLPVQMLPDKFELIVNLKAARSVGLVFPATLVVRADEGRLKKKGQEKYQG